jgi:hypothetical protein
VKCNSILYREPYHKTKTTTNRHCEVRSSLKKYQKPPNLYPTSVRVKCASILYREPYPKTKTTTNRHCEARSSLKKHQEPPNLYPTSVRVKCASILYREPYHKTKTITNRHCEAQSSLKKYQKPPNLYPTSVRVKCTSISYPKPPPLQHHSIATPNNQFTRISFGSPPAFLRVCFGYASGISRVNPIAQPQQTTDKKSF